jgi:capsular polysaccharide biosynthesis protein
MRKAEFAVPSEVMAEFANELAERDLDNKVVGTSEDDEILVEISYEKEETQVVDELEAILDNLREQIEEEDDEDEN